MSAPILLTGATGFIGQQVYRTLTVRGEAVRCAVRRPTPDLPDAVQVGEIDGATDWQEALRGVETVIHLAARVHVIRETAADPLAEFRRVNVAATRHLAEAAAAAGARRLIYVSSIAVNGEGQPRIPDTGYTETDPPMPNGAYGVSKWEAEQELRAVAAATGLEVVIVRPPLVYGEDAKGNFPRLIRLMRLGIPLPFGQVENLRSMVSVQNLASFLAHSVHSPQAAGELFLLSDDQPISTPRLLRELGAAMNRPPRLVSVPPGLMWAGARLVGKQDVLQKLIGSLLINSQKARQLTGWTAPLSLEQGLAIAARWYANEDGKRA